MGPNLNCESYLEATRPAVMEKAQASNRGSQGPRIPGDTTGGGRPCGWQVDGGLDVVNSIILSL